MRNRGIFAAVATGLVTGGDGGRTPSPRVWMTRDAIDYFKAFAGKTVAFVPVTMGIDLTEGWAAVLKNRPIVLE